MDPREAGPGAAAGAQRATELLAPYEAARDRAIALRTRAAEVADVDGLTCTHAAELDRLRGALAEVEAELDGLRTAMQTRAVIEQAKGMLMVQRGIDADAAFDALVNLSQTTHRKLVDVARVLVDTWQAPRDGAP